tara:strand:+ start:5630 stop:6580 length:951 start_codon:yes stop_codon:yes gene_type:complete
MKILFIAPKFEGGIGGHAARVAEKLRKHGFEIKLMDTSSIPIKKLKNPSFAALSTLKSIISREKYDIVHAFNVPSAFAMKYTNARKKVLSVHGVYSEQVNALHSEITSNAAKLAESKVFEWPDKLTTDSMIVKKQYKEKLNIDFDCIYAPLDIEKFQDISDIPKKEKQIVYIGRDSYEKGIDILKKIENKIDANVVYCTDLEWKDAMVKLKESTILVIPSRMESIPQVIKEAFFLKIPIIATNVGGIPELIINDKTGMLVPPDDPQSLKDAIIQLLSDRERMERFADNGFDYVMKNLTWEILLPKYIKFYEDLLSS